MSYNKSKTARGFCLRYIVEFVLASVFELFTETDKWPRYKSSNVSQFCQEKWPYVMEVSRNGVSTTDSVTCWGRNKWEPNQAVSRGWGIQDDSATRGRFGGRLAPLCWGGEGRVRKLSVEVWISTIFLNLKLTFFHSRNRRYQKQASPKLSPWHWNELLFTVL